jgi:hypothetical protein
MQPKQYPRKSLRTEVVWNFDFFDASFRADPEAQPVSDDY